MKISRHSAILLAALVASPLVSCSKKNKQDAEAKAVHDAAVMALKMNPAIEIVKTDDAKGEITYRNKQSGEQVTMSFNDLAQGKFNMKVKDAQGRESSVTGGGDGNVTVNGPDGKMTIDNSAASAPPAWAPTFPGATAMPGAMRIEKGDSITGTHMSETKEVPAKVKEFYEAKLKELGYETEAVTMNFDGKENASVTGKKDDGKRKVSVNAGADSGKTQITLIYEGPKN